MVQQQKNIKLVRIDNRLVHGQVASAWLSHLKVNLLVVANDEASTDDMRQKLMTMAANGTDLRFFSIQKTVDIIAKASDSQIIMLVVETPQDVLKLVEGGVAIAHVNIGNMHMSEGKKQIHPGAAVDERDIDTLKQIHSRGVSMFLQRVPGENPVDIMTLI